MPTDTPKRGDDIVNDPEHKYHAERELQNPPPYGCIYMFGAIMLLIASVCGWGIYYMVKGSLP